MEVEVIILTKNDLNAKKILGRETMLNIGIHYVASYAGGVTFDIISKITGKEFPVSAIRVKKFCNDTQLASVNILSSGFTSPVSLSDGIERAVKFEFIDSESEKGEAIVFESE